MKFLFLSLLLLVQLLVQLLGLGPSVSAETGQTLKVKTELVSSYQTVEPGTSFYVLLTQEITPEWHTYWKNPGDSGAATKLIWDLPDGFSAAEIEWPYPERIVYGPLVNFGFSDSVVLPIKISLADDVASGPAVIRAQVQWLVCADICIPESGKVSVDLMVGGQAVQDVEVMAQLTSARQLLPVEAGFDASYRLEGERLSIKLMLPGLDAERIHNIHYFPYVDGVMSNPEKQDLSFSEHGVTLTTKIGWDYSELSSEPNIFDGIIVIDEDAGERINSSFVIRPTSADPSLVSSFQSEAQSDARSSELGLFTAILFALLGGLILNLMPCVFPVLSIKILSLMQETEDLKGHGWMYVLGVVLSFLAIAGILIALRHSGAEIGWGFQLQSPLVVGLLVYLFVLIGLNLSGYFEIGTRLMSLGQGGSAGGYTGSFSTGILAALVAAPCSAPFMATAIGFALTQGDLEALLIFGSLGLGMALPYLLLCYWPPLLRRLPRPGPWMDKMKQLLAFPMYASAIWLFWVLSIQSGSQGVLFTASGILLMALAIWLLNNLPSGHLGRLLLQSTALVLLVGALFLPSRLETVSMANAAQPDLALGVDSRGVKSSGGLVYGVYSEETLTELRKSGPVFINFDAAWCITCKLNEAVALRSDAVLQAFEDRGIAALKGDWTNQDPKITRKLAEYQRSGVPLYLLYAGQAGQAEVLPQLLTEDNMLAAISRLP